jgi:arsenate reductase (glutaredoxin)
MQKAILIHNPRCSKSRGAKEILEEKGIQFDTIDYLKDGLKEKLLSHLPTLLELPYIDMIRKNEDIYKELKLADKKLSHKEWIEILRKHPILLERPIFINGDKAVIGRPPELVHGII